MNTLKSKIDEELVKNQELVNRSVALLLLIQQVEKSKISEALFT